MTDTIIVPFEIKALEDVPGDEFVKFSGLASTFGNLDRGGDIMQPSAFDLTVSKLTKDARPIPALPGELKLLPVLWQHDMDEPIGSFIKLGITSEGLRVDGIMPKADTFVSGRVVPQMRVGSVGEMSIGYITKQSSRDEEGNRLLEVVELLEISLVTIAMNPKAAITSIKSLENLEIAERGTGIEADKGYLWVPESGDPQYPVMAEIDGNDRLIPEALFKAVPAISVDKELTVSQKTGLLAKVTQFYDKLGLDNPFQERDCVRIDDLAGLDARSLEKALKSGVFFDRKNAKILVSAIKTLMRDVEEEETRDANLIAELNKLSNLFTKRSIPCHKKSVQN